MKTKYYYYMLSVAALGALTACHDPIDVNPGTCATGAGSSVYLAGKDRANKANAAEYERGKKAAQEDLTRAVGVKDGKAAIKKQYYDAEYSAAYTPAYNTAYGIAYNDNSNFNSGRDKGKQVGKDDGRSKGIKAGDAAAKDVSNKEADKFGLKDGKYYGIPAGEQAAYTVGTKNGKAQGASDGYEDGFYDGYELGDIACVENGGTTDPNAKKGKKEDDQRLRDGCEAVGYNEIIALTANYQAGFAYGKANNTEYAAGYEEGKKDQASIDAGKSEGKAYGQSKGTSDGKTNGAKKRYDEGYVVGYNEVYQTTFDQYKNDEYYRVYNSYYTQYYNQYYAYYYNYYYEYTYNALYDGYYVNAYDSVYSTYYASGKYEGYNSAADDCHYPVNGRTGVSVLANVSNPVKKLTEAEFETLAKVRIALVDNNPALDKVDVRAEYPRSSLILNPGIVKSLLPGEFKSLAQVKASAPTPAYNASVKVSGLKAERAINVAAETASILELRRKNAMKAWNAIDTGGFMTKELEYALKQRGNAAFTSASIEQAKAVWPQTEVAKAGKQFEYPNPLNQLKDANAYRFHWERSAEIESKLNK